MHRRAALFSQEQRQEEVGVLGDVRSLRVHLMPLQCKHGSTIIKTGAS